MSGWYLLYFIACIYFLFVALLYILQGKMLYFPTRDRYVTPDLAQLAYEEVHFSATDGTRLWGWFIPREGASLTLLFCHGNAGNLTHRLDSILTFHKLGMNVFIFDYRGYGQSEGTPDETGTYRDGEGAWKHLVDERGIDPGEIVIFGRSLGGGIASYLAEKFQPRALALESTFTSVVDVAAHHYRFLPVRLLVRIGYPNLRRMAKIKCPLLVIHSPGDEIIPFDHGEKLFEGGSGPKEFLEIRGGHNDGFSRSKEIYRRKWAEFLEKHLT